MLGAYGPLLRHRRSLARAMARAAATARAGAFDDAADYARHDIVNHPPHYAAPIWIDVGMDDPFHDTAVHYAHEIHAHAPRLAGRPRRRLLARAHARSTLRSMPGTAPSERLVVALAVAAAVLAGCGGSSAAHRQAASTFASSASRSIAATCTPISQ